MKILKNKTYQELIDKIERLTKDNQDLNKSLLKAREYAIDIDSEKTKLRWDIKSLSKFEIKRFICGFNGTGKTTLVKKAIPQLPSYFIIHSFDEYSEFDKANRKLVTTKAQLTKAINSAPKNVIFIFDLLAELYEPAQKHIQEKNLHFLMTVFNQNEITPKLRIDGYIHKLNPDVTVQEVFKQHMIEFRKHFEKAERQVQLETTLNILIEGLKKLHLTRVKRFRNNKK